VEKVISLKSLGQLTWAVNGTYSRLICDKKYWPLMLV